MLYEDSDYDPYGLNKNIEKLQNSSWGNVELKDLVCENKEQASIPFHGNYLNNEKHQTQSYAMMFGSPKKKNKMPYIYELLYKFLLVDIAVAAVIQAYFYLV